MTETEIIERAEASPIRFADRVTESTLWSIRAHAAAAANTES